ncbi:MAG: ABC transporter substrate-binding protein [Methylococcales bacterium]|nr:ABC transporter substrate-binding protein [Methylococcales bacterium]
MNNKINIMVLRHSAFYSPLLYTIKGGFLKAEGLESNYQLATPEKTIPASLHNGSVHLAQFAVAGSFPQLERGEKPEIVHFAQINQKDGFFIAGKPTKTPFSWEQLIGKKILVDHLFQPLAMFNYALHTLGIDRKQINSIDAGDVLAMEEAFRAGKADYIHQQGPAPQQLEYEGKATVLASVGDVIGEVAFSSLCATRTWLKTEHAQAFMRAYQKACCAIVETPAAEIAALEADFFPNIPLSVLTETIKTYQALGCWSANPCISETSYNTLQDVFLYNQLISQRHDYQKAIVQPFN